MSSALVVPRASTKSSSCVMRTRSVPNRTRPSVWRGAVRPACVRTTLKDRDPPRLPTRCAVPLIRLSQSPISPPGNHRPCHPLLLCTLSQLSYDHRHLHARFRAELTLYLSP